MKTDIENTSIGDLLVESAKEAVAIHRGRMAKKHTVDNTDVVEIDEISPEKIKAIQQKYDLSTEVFGKLLGASAKTIQAWERGASHPNKYAYRLMNILAENPMIVEKLLIKNK